MITPPIRVLLAEDITADAELEIRELKRAGLRVTARIVDRADTFAAALREFTPDVILSDFSMPGFDGMEALALARETSPDTPFLFVSGTIGEEYAIRALKSGATDYVLKSNLVRLPAAVTRALEEAEEHRGRQRAQGELDVARDRLREREAGLRRAQAIAKLGHVITGVDGAFESWSETLPPLIGLEASQMPKSTRDWLDMLHPDDRERLRSASIEAAVKGTRVDVEYRLRRPDGAWMHIRQVIEPLQEQSAAAEPSRWFSTLQDVTEQKRAEEELRESESLKGAILESSLDALITIDRQGRITEFNPAAQETFGISRQRALGKLMAELIVPPRLREAHHRGFAHYLATGEGPILGKRLELEAIRADGTEFPIELAITAINTGSAPLFTGFIRDITARKEAETRIIRLNRVYAVLSGINALIVRVRDREELFKEACRLAVEAGKFRMAWLGLVDRESMLVKPIASAGEVRAFFDSAPLAVTEASPGGHGLAGRAIRDKKPVISNDVHSDPQRLMKTELEERGINSLAIIPLLIGGEAVGVLALYAADVGFFDEEETRLLLELAGNIAFALEHIQKAEKLDYLADYDELTGLANRSLFHERLGQKLSAARSAQRKQVVFILDIERFKTINDAFGRQAGDELLKQVAGRMVQVSGDPSRLARIGADHFSIMAADLENEEQVGRYTDARLDACFGPPYRVGTHDLRVSARVGIAIFPEDGKDAESLLRSAEAALKKAKATGERYLFFNQKMTERIAEKLSLENKLRQALEKDEFILHYQPKVDLERRSIVGVEALIRWQSPELGLVPPLQFIALLEETGLILPVGSWALKRASLDHRSWSEQKLKPPRVAVNVSPIQLRQRNFVEVVEQAIMGGLAPTAIDLEITESLIMEDIQGNIQKLNAVRALGISIAIDDFGTGYSSLGYLAKLPVQALKIDRSFINAMNKDPNAMTLVSTIISLAHSLRLKVIAEGVETEDQAKILRLLKCDEMQGYLFSKPLPLQGLVELLRKT
jgi:PAS domain S-box-containing protein/diguanylate cyclase (GGDEF)-like protein